MKWVIGQFFSGQDLMEYSALWQDSSSGALLFETVVIHVRDGIRQCLTALR